MDILHHLEDWKCRGNLFEFRKWCILVHGHMRSCSWCALQISSQDGCALLGESRKSFRKGFASTARMLAEEAIHLHHQPNGVFAPDKSASLRRSRLWIREER